MMIFLLVLLLLAAIAIFTGVKSVPQGQQWTVERFGRYQGTLKPGLSLIVPFIDRIGHRLNVQETPLEIASQMVISKDNATLTVDGIVFYQVLEAGKAAYEVRNLEVAIKAITMTNIRTAIGALDLDETLSKRDEINERLLRVLDAATEPWGTKITRVELKDVRPPDDLITSMSKQLTAERSKRAQVLQAEGVKQAAILKAEGEKQATILAAEARLTAANRDAEARERLAEAEAVATTSVSKAVTEGNIQAINYFVAQKYIDAFSKIASSENPRLVILPMEMSSLASAIAGIAEIARPNAGAAS